MENLADKYLYKILSKPNWEASKSKKSVVLSADDDDFIHFSKEDQLQKICSKYWGHISEYYILKIEIKKLKGRLAYETNPGGTSKYYHLYDGEIPLEAVVDATLHKKSVTPIL